MKKFFVCVLLIVVIGGIAFSQESRDWNWAGTVRFKPAASILPLLIGVLEGVVDWVPYVSPNVGIPIEFDVAYISGAGIFGYSIMAGIEGIVGSQKEKNGLYLSALAGPMIIENVVLFNAKADIGYQLVTDGGFVFTPAVGVKYSSINGFGYDVMLDIGFAYKKR